MPPIPRNPIRLLLGLGLLGLASLSWIGCDDPCEVRDEPLLILGTGVGGAFEPMGDGEQVSLQAAPQGGFGVSALLRTVGLTASNTALADAQLDVLIDGTVEGSFLLEDARLLCRSDGDGGEISGVVVGFDPDIYLTTGDLLDLNGQSVVLDVSVTDEGGATAHTLQPVTVVYGD